jgi:hypothetical protein
VTSYAPKNQVRFPAWAGFFLRYNFQTGSEVHPDSYPAVYGVCPSISSAQFRNSRVFLPPTYGVMIRHRDDLTFYLHDMQKVRYHEKKQVERIWMKIFTFSLVYPTLCKCKKYM